MSKYGKIISYTIINKDYYSEGVKVSKQTAQVSFSKDEGVTSDIELPYFPENVLFEKIEQNHEICLDNCFVDNFSLLRYRVKNNIDKKEAVVIKKLSARNALFYSQTPIDFSYVIFESDNVVFDDSVFYKGEVSFHAAKFGNGLVSFANTWFNCSKTDFANLRFRKWQS